MQCLEMYGLFIKPSQTHTFDFHVTFLYALSMNVWILQQTHTFDYHVTFLNAMSMNVWKTHETIPNTQFWLHCQIPGCLVYECMDYTYAHHKLLALSSLSHTWIESLWMYGKLKNPSQTHTLNFIATLCNVLKCMDYSSNRPKHTLLISM
jgi:hypothetical protein